MGTRVAQSPHPAPTVAPVAPPLRALHARYDLQERLGAGCAGTVVRAIERASGQEVAVKIVSKRLLVGKECRMALAREVSVLSKVQHPGVVRFCNAFEDTDFVYISTEYCCGGDLHQCLRARGGGMGEREALKYVRQVLDALSYLHKRGISHCDVKLENVSLVEGRAKLIDFGLCYWRRPGGQKTTRRHVGTPAYASPEIMRKLPYSPELADMWALGVMLYALLTRRLPFSGATWEDLEHNIAYANTKSLLASENLSYVSPGTMRVLRRLLSVIAGSRPSPDEAIELVDDALLGFRIQTSKSF